ncbi:MAG: NAD(P)-binding domain-containing protein [Bacteroidetes bacterium]|nr:NAD(P)-binding domain-containing protein [Bacteroidota bacterium]
MKIAVFGTGVVGQVMAEKLSSLGHEVMIGTRDVKGALAKTAPDNFGRPGFADWYKAHTAIRLGTYAETAAFGSFLVNASSGNGSLALLEQAGEANLSGKVMLDIANPLDFSKGMPPSLFICNTDSLGEQIQRAHPSLKVVKSLNTMNAQIMVNPSLIPGDHNVFVCGNDADAKSRVKEVLKSFGWKEKSIIDLGDISTARGTEQLLPIWIRLWGALKNPMFNFHIATA